MFVREREMCTYITRCLGAVGSVRVEEVCVTCGAVRLRAHVFLATFVGSGW